MTPLILIGGIGAALAVGGWLESWAHRRALRIAEAEARLDAVQRRSRAERDPTE